jgi:hypothetical protein
VIVSPTPAAFEVAGGAVVIGAPVVATLADDASGDDVSGAGEEVIVFG